VTHDCIEFGKVRGLLGWLRLEFYNLWPRLLNALTSFFNEPILAVQVNAYGTSAFSLDTSFDGEGCYRSAVLDVSKPFPLR